MPNLTFVCPPLGPAGFYNLILMLVPIMAVFWPGAHHCVECGININVLIQDPGFTFNAMDIDNV